MIAVAALGGEEERGELPPMEPPTRGGVDLGATDVFGRVGADPPVDVGGAAEATYGRQAMVDGRGGQAPLLDLK